MRQLKKVVGFAVRNPAFIAYQSNLRNSGRQAHRASRQSAEWCLAAVSQCWSQKSIAISASEKDSARKAYDHAREVYQQLISESQ